MHSLIHRHSPIALAGYNMTLQGGGLDSPVGLFSLEHPAPMLMPDLQHRDLLCRFIHRVKHPPADAGLPRTKEHLANRQVR